MEALRPERVPDKPTFSLVFPTYNPGPILGRTVRKVERFLEKTAGWEVIFVCDGCTDDSVHQLHDFSGLMPERVRVVSYAPNRGKGYAVRRGLEAARGRWRLFTDVDLAYDFDEIGRLADVLIRGAELVIADRFHASSRVVVKPALLGHAWRRQLQSLLFSQVARLLLPIRPRDTQAGLKGFSANAVATLLPHLHCDGFAFDCELLALCEVLGIAVAEAPVWVRYDHVRTTTSFGTAGRMIRDLWRIRRECRKIQQRLERADRDRPIKRQAA
jgi:glycosyltransferase involved in cell wall biosynthesis